MKKFHEVPGFNSICEREKVNKKNQREMKEVQYENQSSGNKPPVTQTEAIYSYYPSSGEWGTTPFYKDSALQLKAKAEAAAEAFQQYRRKSGQEKALFLEAIADEMEAIGEPLIQICSGETALPKVRLQGERARTTGQLRLFASLLRDGSWAGAKIDTALPERTPLPRPDLRQMQVALGPVAVFGASNFPLAFSVAGGDTASALAAGCPVIFKAHPAHPATSHLVAEAISKAVKKTGMPEAVFFLVYGDADIAMQLVQQSEIKAVAFTGSYRVGKIIFDAAARRPEPIPVYAEMGSLNPVFVLPGAMQERGEKIAQGFAGSLTLGVGQFCTNPGLLVYPQPENTSFLPAVKKAVEASSGGCMLTEAICETFTRQVTTLKKEGKVQVLAEGKPAEAKHGVHPVLFKTDSETYRRTEQLKEEMFGPASILVEGKAKEDLLQFAREMEGHLTATVHGTEADLMEYSELLKILEQKAGRVVINGFPTGVEVSHAMVHGGPFPATTDSRSTSVGTTAIYRFTRPVCFQDYPQALLPEELKEENPLGILRLVNGEYRR
jgi:2,5-dioxopentanoate dehydrogenase